MRSALAATALAAALLPLASAAQSANPGNSNRFTGDSLSASVFENLPGGGYRYVYVSAYQNLSVKGDAGGAQVSAYQSYAGPTGWGYRQIWCAIPVSALEVKKNSGGRLAATLDSASAACSSYGGRYDAGGGPTGPWPFASEAVSLALANPQYTTEGNSRVVSTDNAAGTTFQDNCRTFSGYGASGAMTLGPQTWTLAPATSASYLNERACNSKVR